MLDVFGKIVYKLGVIFVYSICFGLVFVGRVYGGGFEGIDLVVGKFMGVWGVFGNGDIVMGSVGKILYYGCCNGGGCWLESWG